jgi:ribose transport system substrate-binding protein
MKKFSAWVFPVLALVSILISCTKKSTEVSDSGAGNPSSVKPKKLYLIVPLKGHPALQIAQAAFKEGCRNSHYDSEILGTEGWDVAGTIALAEQAMAKGDVAGMVIWSGNPAFNPFVEKAGKAGVPIILPHFPLAEGSTPGATGIIGCDPAEYGRESAIEIAKAIGGKGTVAITQGGFNTTENLASESFKKAMHELYPAVKVLEPVEEGFDPPRAIAKAVSLLQANPDVVGAFSTTGAGSTTWALAQRETGRKVVSVGMDYTRVNLDLVKNGEVYAVVGQPLWHEAYGAVELIDKTLRGEKIPWWTKLPAPFITKEKVGPYYELLESKVEPAMRR